MIAHICALLLAGVLVLGSTQETMLSDDMVPPMSKNPDVTGSGCTCAGPCGATLTQGNAACDWCWTKGECGQWSLRGHWDYCVYPKMVSWEGLSFDQKEDRIWKSINAPGSVGQSSPMPSTLDSFSGAMTESMITTFDDQWDVFPEGRSKVIHHQGAVCKFDLDVSAQAFTGLFAAGKSQGIIRLGSATPSDSPLGIHPGISLKFLRSAVRSANFVALAESPTTENYNFFWRKLSNKVAPAKALQMTGKFQQASGCINQVGLSDVCKYAQDGTEVGTPVFPYEIQFEPAGMSFNTEKMSPEELMRQLSSIPAGTPIFHVYTYSSPLAAKQGKREKFGTLTISSQCVQSLYGDNKLFFRHQRMEEDFALKPEWIPDATGEACDASSAPISKWQCASPFKQTLTKNFTSILV